MLKPGVVLDEKYKIISVIGQGGMSTVYLADHQRLGQKWAVKEISREYCENYELVSRQLIVEAELLKKLDHPGLPKVIDIIEKKDVVWMIMEFIEGKTLKEVLKKENAMKEEDVLAFGKQLCDVLSYLHSRTPPVIYRDLKPDNIILKKTGRLVLIDFGTAREYCYENNSSDTTYLGTRGYAAPEQYGGRGQTDERTDIYCLGVTLYSLLTGYNPEKPPYKIYPEKYWGKYMSLGMKQVILKCIHPEPENRYQNCKELSYALSQTGYENHNVRQKEKKKARRLRIYILAFLLSVIFSFGCSNVVSLYKKKVIKLYIETAERCTDRTEAEQYYKQALHLVPDEKRIYQSLIKYFIRPNYFKTDDASRLTSIVMTPYSGKIALDILRKNNPSEYMDFCYNVGIGYFYDMGGVTGKSASEKWFYDVITILDKEKNNNFDKGKKKRVAVYANIAGYYNTFLLNGMDKSGERENSDFLDFYEQLCELNRFEIKGQGKKSDISAAYLISQEVAIEISNYAEQFLENRKISKVMLEKELKKIRARIEYLGESEETDRLNELVYDAQKKLDISDSFKYKGDEGDEGGT